MKKVKIHILTLTLLFISNIGIAQIAAVKKFDYSILEDKVLYIPSYELSEGFISRMTKKGKFDKLASRQEKVDLHNKAWKEAMAESSYDATDYKIGGFDEKDQKKLFKDKDPKAIFLQYYTDKYGNEQAMLVVTGPKKKIIARSVITGLDLSEKNDIRLMINMLNESMNTASEIQDEGGKASRKNFRSKYKVALVEWAKDLENKTFLVPKSTHKKAKKAEERNADLEAALKNWKLSKYEFTTEEEINNKRIEGDENSFYWKTFRIYTNSPLIIFNYNLILSTDGDDIITGFLGKKRLKPTTLDLIQNKITSKVERYKKQLEK